MNIRELRKLIKSRKYVKVWAPVFSCYVFITKRQALMMYKGVAQCFTCREEITLSFNTIYFDKK